MTSSQPYTGDNLHFITGTEENSFVFKRIAIHRDTTKLYPKVPVCLLSTSFPGPFPWLLKPGTRPWERGWSFVIQLELSELKETTSGLWESGQQLCFCCPPRRH